MSVKDSQILRECPFCGGEAEIIETEYSWNLNITHEPACFFAVEVDSQWSKDKAIEAWNTRAERTCECIVEYAKSPLDGKTIVLHRCSSCNELMRPHMNYCPSCGCKVVGE